MRYSTTTYIEYGINTIANTVSQNPFANTIPIRYHITIIDEIIDYILNSL